MTAINHSTRITCEIQACLIDIIPGDVARIIAEYSLRTEQEKLICVLKAGFTGESRDVSFNTSAFNRKITKFAIQKRSFEYPCKWVDTRYTIVISGPEGELGSSVGFDDLCVNSSYWIRRMSGILQTAGIEYRKQMTELMLQF